MKSFIAAFLIAFVVSVATIPLARRVALRLGAVSHPGGRNVHRQSIPRLGGVPIFFAFLVPVVALFFFPQSVVASAVINDSARVVGVVLGGAIMCAVGAFDDLRGMRATHKLVLQIGVAILAYACGLRIEGVALPWGGSVSTDFLALPITILWIVGVINAINLIDGLDGLAGGVVFFAGVTNFTVAAFISYELFTAVILAATLGAVLAFLFYNSNPARIFMGDSGSYFLGFILATTSLSGGAPKTSTAVALLVPVLALGVPIIDTLFAMIRRVLQRRPIFSPDRGHIHHRLLDLGITQHRAVLIIYSACIVLTVAAIGISLNRSWEIGVALLIASIALIGLIRVFSGFRRRALTWPRDSEALRRALPSLPRLFEEADDEREIFDALRVLCERASFEFVEIEDVAGSEATLVYRWPDAPTQTDTFHVTGVFAIGAESKARAMLRIGWVSELGDIRPEIEVMLQIVTDMLELHLTRVKSRLAPHPVLKTTPRTDAATEPAEPATLARDTGS